MSQTPHTTYTKQDRICTLDTSSYSTKKIKISAELNKAKQMSAVLVTYLDWPWFSLQRMCSLFLSWYIHLYHSVIQLQSQNPLAIVLLRFSLWASGVACRYPDNGYPGQDFCFHVPVIVYSLNSNLLFVGVLGPGDTNLYRSLHLWKVSLVVMNPHHYQLPLWSPTLHKVFKYLTVLVSQS